MRQNPGAHIIDGKCRLVVWAPLKRAMYLHIVAPDERIVVMSKDEHGYFSVELPLSYAGCQYYYRPDNEADFPDPASHCQPYGVNRPSQLIDQYFAWTDSSWRNIPLKDYIIYELHIGTFTEDGTFEAAIARLDDLVELGITAIEIMPVAQFPGEYNWGYDGVFPYAVQNSYGGYHGFKELVNACHERELAVILDVVYNHLGPEGNCLSAYGPYFTDKYTTPWGQAINFDGPYSDGVRDYFCANALYWFRHFHVDALRLDAIHQMYDFGAEHFWEYLRKRVDEFCKNIGQACYLIAESDLNNPRIVRNIEAGGYGFDGQWLDDFHHALYVMIYPGAHKRYEDFGRIDQLAKAFTDGYVHSGEYVNFRRKRFGRSSAGLPGDQFITFIQNHDQVGNTVGSSRLAAQIDLPLLKIAAAAVLLSPYVPMLFMGEEYAEDAPFNYFIDHEGKDLIKTILEGRKKEFEHDHWDTAPPDPKEPGTFIASKLQWHKRAKHHHAQLLHWYKKLIALRKSNMALRNFDRRSVRVNIAGDKAFTLHRVSDDYRNELLAIFNFSGEPFTYTALSHYSSWKIIVSSVESRWYPATLDEGPLHIPGYSVTIYVNQ